MVSARRKGRPVFVLMLALASLLSIPPEVALAAMIETDAFLPPAGGAALRERLCRELDRAEVRSALRAQGIDPAEAEARIRGLTDAELAQAAGDMDRLPAGGDGIGVAIGVLLIVLLVVVILKVAGKLK